MRGFWLIGIALGLSLAARAQTTTDDLFQAIRNNDREALKAPLAAGADVNSRDKRGNTLLMQAAAFKNKATGSTGFDVVTHHYDLGRTGWNSQETILTASNVNSSTFGLLRSVALDDFVDAQPIVLTNQAISGVTGNRTVSVRVS
jgi:ankyrin repeat protein